MSTLYSQIFCKLGSDRSPIEMAFSWISLDPASPVAIAYRKKTILPLRKSYHDDCSLRRDSDRVLSAANTDAPCRRHNTRMNHPVTSTWQRANQSWLYPLNAERLPRKQPVPMLTPLVWFGRVRNRDHPTTRRTLYPLGHAAGCHWEKRFCRINGLERLNAK